MHISTARHNINNFQHGYFTENNEEDFLNLDSDVLIFVMYHFRYHFIEEQLASGSY